VSRILLLIFSQLRCCYTLIEAMARSKCIVTLALALILSQALCAAQCAWQTCPLATESVPPCHHHHSNSTSQTPASCAFEILTARSIAPSQASSFGIPQIAVARLQLEGNFQNSGIDRPVFAGAFSPPLTAPLVLRI
jgi:hypothetical protein